MQVTKISATPRTDNGKGACRRLRAAGQLPAVTYGPGIAPQGLVVSPDDVAHVLLSERGRNSVVELDIAGKSVTAMIVAYQYHPVSRKLLHADFIQVTEETKVEVTIPLHLTGKVKGVTMGGKLRQVYRELPIRCVPSAIPVGITHDVSHLEIEQGVRIAELNLPEGVEVLLDAKRTFASVVSDRRSKKEEEEAAAAAPAKPEAKK
ncbi:MAG TPA: 50S ribosomal protein L25 [Polyangiaceae bacterium]|nr:50S ribosomal protein L25 [Polyangiaceae bacterium]